MPMVAALTAWREAERRWEATDLTDDAAVRAAALAVINAWIGYQTISGSAARDALLMADAGGTVVTANAAPCPGHAGSHEWRRSWP